MSVVDDVKDRLDVVDVISGYVPLKKSGRTFKATCPFHAEKTPSFVVDPQRQTWRCFGACATGGDAFSFVMRKDGLSFGDALRQLAEKAGVEIRPREQAERTDVLLRTNNEAAAFYGEALASPKGEHARRYLRERGIDDDTAAAFQLGLSPRGGTTLRDHLSSLGHDVEHAVDAGLLRRFEDSGNLRDFFWGRLMFPIHDRRGRVAGFGARTLDGSDPKYINTPATRVFDKRATLYGLHLAAPAIREKDEAVVVEGYMDTIAAHQHGYANVVASMGTALTEQQVAQIRSLASGCVLALDPDQAGQEATLRSLESSWRVVDMQRARAQAPADGAYRRKSMNLRIASLPAGRDPDALIREEPAAWERVLADAVPFMHFYIRAMVARYDVNTNEGKQDAVTALSPAISATSNAFDQDEYITMLADSLGVDRRLLEGSISRRRQPAPRRRDERRGNPREEAAVLADRRDRLEDYALALLLQYPDLREREGDLETDYFRRTENRELFTCLRSSITMEDVRDELDESLHEHLDGLSALELSPTETWPVEEAFGQAVRRLQQRHLKELQVVLLATDDMTVPPVRDVEDPVADVNAGLRESFARRGI